MTIELGNLTKQNENKLHPSLKEEHGKFHAERKYQIMLINFEDDSS